MGRSSYSVETEESGEWWPLHRVEGEWKTQWLRGRWYLSYSNSCF